MFDFEKDLYFIQCISVVPAPVVSSAENLSLHEFIGLCYKRLHEAVTCMLPLTEKLEHYPQMYFGIGLLIRSVLTDVLALQMMLTIVSENGNGDEQLLELEKISSLFIKDGVQEILNKAELDLSKDVSTKIALDKMKVSLAKFYPDDFSMNDKNELEFHRKRSDKSPTAKDLYKKLVDYKNLPNREVIAQIFDQYDMFSKFEHTSKLTRLLTEIPLDKMVYQIEKSSFYLLLHLDNIFQLYKNIDTHFNERFKLVRERLELYFQTKDEIASS